MEGPRARELADFANNYRPGPRSLPDVRLEMLRSPQLGTTFRHGFKYPDAIRADEAVKVLLAQIETAPLYWCSADMVSLVEAAHLTMPDQKLEEIDPPSPHGLVFMETPFTDPDTSILGTDIPTNALLWMVNYVTDQDLWAVNIISLTNVGGDVGWFVPGFTTWPFGQCRQAAGDPIDQADRGRAAALWTLSQQSRVCPVATSYPDRAAARRLKAAGMPPTSGDVRLLDLRRPAGSNAAGGSHIEYSHRWMVSGHWRNQWMPASRTHRAQWIAPHVKGPDDKPLVIRDDVRVVR